MEKGIARLAPLTGFLAVLLGIVAFLLFWGWADAPDSDAPAAEIAAWMTDDSWAIFIVGWLWMLAAASFLWFLGSLRVVLRRGEGGDARVTSIAYGAGLLLVAMLVLFIAPGVAGAAADEFDDRVISPELADSLWVLGNMFFFAAEIFVGVLAVATAIVTLRSRVLPRWFGWLGLLWGVWMLILPIGWIGVIGIPIWILLTTFLVWRVESKAGAAAAAPA